MSTWLLGLYDLFLGKSVAKLTPEWEVPLNFLHPLRISTYVFLFGDWLSMFHVEVAKCIDSLLLTILKSFYMAGDTFLTAQFMKVSSSFIYNFPMSTKLCAEHPISLLGHKNG